MAAAQHSYPTNGRSSGGQKLDGGVDECTPLLNGQDSKRGNGYLVASSAAAARPDEEVGPCEASLSDKPPRQPVPRNIVGVVSVLLLGVFVVYIDTSLVLVTSGTISSEFGDFENSGWIITSYTLAMCATQSLYGQLSDIYGCKTMIIVSYAFFFIGSAICGLGQTLLQVVVGRIISGVGGAGINCLVSIVIAETMPIREVASWRSYVNIAATTGRSLGGPIGGYLCDTIGWRWSFLLQCPPTLLAMALVAWKLKLSNKELELPASQYSKLMRVDFLGGFLLATSVVLGLLALDIVGGQQVPWSDLRILAAFSASLVTGICFLLVEALWATEPVFPLRLLLNRDVVTSYINLCCQSAAQMAMMAFVPMYFQVSAHVSTTEAGAHLMPSVIGNAIGGLTAGVAIRRTGRYKLILAIGAVSSSIAYLLMMLRWHGHTSFLESLYIIPGGFGNGIVLSASFISLTAGIDPCQLAIATSGLYLSSNIGMVGGLSIANAVLMSTLTRHLRTSLKGMHNIEGITHKALTDLTYVTSLHGRLGEIITQAYVTCLTYTHVVSFTGSILALAAALCVREHKL